MEKYIMVVTNEQIERSKARKKAIEALEYNPMCYNCKNFENLAKGQQIKYIADASIKRLTNLSRLYMHRLRNK